MRTCCPPATASRLRSSLRGPREAYSDFHSSSTATNQPGRSRLAPCSVVRFYAPKTVYKTPCGNRAQVSSSVFSLTQAQSYPVGFGGVLFSFRSSDVIRRASSTVYTA
uniref:(northern house mosquito) hypothetical protein n=1 Tax=Culex pipiens TaxID=7175 RepID=A0A8D8CI34_CULPI